jgi:Leucine-rich repeat (LRR) protein
MCFPLSLFAQSEGFFSNLDSALANPERVITLSLCRQRLKEVPQKISNLKNLQRLILYRNDLKSLPKELSYLHQLHYIDISSNYIDSLPKEMAALPLDTIIAWDNHIRSFPQEFSTLSNSLKYLDLRAIPMNKQEQKAIKELFPQAKTRMAHPCNCNRYW